REAIDPRQAEIENDSIVTLGLDMKIGGCAVVRPIDGITGGLEGCPEVCGQARFVFDDEQSHQWRVRLNAIELARSAPSQEKVGRDRTRALLTAVEPRFCRGVAPPVWHVRCGGEATARASP